MKIAVFGGAFNPPHLEHINMIKAALSEGVDKVIVVPSKNPPHKSCPTSFLDRVNMLNIALLGVKNVEIDEIENEDYNVHYSYETIPKLINKYGKIEFIIGGDSLIDFHKWKNPEEIIKLVQLDVFYRGNRDLEFNKAKEYWQAKGAIIKVFNYKPKDISSTLIRYNLELGFNDGLDEKVYRYIRENGLFSEYNQMLTKISNYIYESRFMHCLRTAKYALKVNYDLSLGLDYKKVFIAGVLHDLGKATSAKEDLVKFDIPKDSIDTPIEHEFTGAIIAKEDFNIQDEDILSAIRYHSTGNKDMTTLQKLIYCADLLEEGRCYGYEEELRQALYEDFEKGFRKCLLSQYNYLKEKGGNIYPLTKIAADYYSNK